MATCPVCGGINFEKHAGYMYCMECQTQSQDYQEQEYEYGAHDRTITSKAQTSKKKSKKKAEEDIGTTTSWEILNYVLYGMTQEVISLCKTKNLDAVVLQLWACYLNRMEAGFTSITTESLPKLQFSYRKRDAKILYNFDTLSICSSKKSSRSKKSKKSGKSMNSQLSLSSQSSVLEDSRRRQSMKKRKIVDSDYQEQISSQTLDTSLANETIESLGKSDDDISSAASDDVPLSVYKECFAKSVYKDYKLAKKSVEIFSNLKNSDMSSAFYLNKCRLLAIIHLALLLTKSNVYLSDLLRFIREGHLSFAKVSHFLPNTVKVSKEDFFYVESLSDDDMPSYERQRSYCAQVANLLNIEEIACPSAIPLLNRYCKELKLPDEVRVFGTEIIKLLENEKIIEFKGRGSKFFNLEGIALGTIIFILKFYFGLDDKTERVMSNTARVVNRILDENENQLFVFEDWQKYIECRKTIIKDFHYPTQERFSDDCCSSKKFIEMLMKETKDEFKKERASSMKRQWSFMNENLLAGVNDVLASMSEEMEFSTPDFKPTLKPQQSYLKSILKGCSSDRDLQSSSNQNDMGSSEQRKFPLKMLNSDFSKCNIDFGAKPDAFIELLRERQFKTIKTTRSEFLKLNWEDLKKSIENNEIFFIDCNTCYWIRPFENQKERQFGHVFNSEFFLKLPYNFQWLLSECARLAEMQVFFMYREVRFIEGLFTHKNA